MKYLELINGFDKLFAEEDERAIQILGKYGDESVFLGLSNDYKDAIKKILVN